MRYHPDIGGLRLTLFLCCSIYVELADQYKEIDAVSNVAKRNVLAEHLREVIDILEQKVHSSKASHNILRLADVRLFRETTLLPSTISSRTRISPCKSPLSLTRPVAPAARGQQHPRLARPGVARIHAGDDDTPTTSYCF